MSRDRNHRRKEENMVNASERRIVRHISLWSLQMAYEQMRHGESHAAVCSILEIDTEVMNGSLRPALEEALWERGHLRRK
jgi:hypothetical protein